MFGSGIHKEGGLQPPPTNRAGRFVGILHGVCLSLQIGSQAYSPGVEKKRNLTNEFVIGFNGL